MLTEYQLTVSEFMGGDWAQGQDAGDSKDGSHWYHWYLVR